MTQEEKAKAYDKAMNKIKPLYEQAKRDNNPIWSTYEYLIPELAESEDERIRKEIVDFIRWAIDRGSITKEQREKSDTWFSYLEKQKEYVSNNFDDVWDEEDCEEIIAEGQKLTLRFNELLKEVCHAWYDRGAKLERQKEQKPIIQDVELNDAVYDYVRDHFIAGADFTPEYIKKLMENAFFAGVDYYLLKQEFESCEPDTNVEKVIEDVIRVYGKTQGEWVGSYDVDTLIVNLRLAFNKKEQKPADLSEMMVHKEPYIAPVPTPMVADEQKSVESISQRTVQGKGVYKICPRCKERMVRDDSMVYTSMPPQYGYECPKCGEREFDTVMYDNPEMEEQKPAELAMQQLKGE